MGAKRLGGKRPGGKRLGGETTRGGNGLGAKRPGFMQYKKIHYLTFDIDLWVRVTQNNAQYPLHHVTYAPASLLGNMARGSGEDALTRKYKFVDYCTSDLGHTHHAYFSVHFL